MALLKYNGDVYLSRNKILDILKIQGPNSYSGLSNSLEITTKKELNNKSGDLILKSGPGTNSKGLEDSGGVYLFAGRDNYTKLPSTIDENSLIYGITIFPGTEAKNNISIKSGTTKIISDTQVYLKKGGTTLTLEKGDKENSSTLKIVSEEISLTDSVKTSISSTHLMVNVPDKAGSSLKVDTEANASSAYIITTPTLNVTDHANVTNWVDIGGIRVKYDSSSSCLIFGSKS